VVGVAVSRLTNSLDTHNFLKPRKALPWRAPGTRSPPRFFSRVTEWHSKMNPVVQILPWEYERGFAVGIGRFVANWGTSDAPYYDRSLMEEDRSAQPAAAICELAVAKYTGKYWHGGVWCRGSHHKYKHLADVGDNIEVRRVRTGKAVKVRRKDAGKVIWAARTADAEYRSVEILGFISADEVIASLVGTYEDDKYVDISMLHRPWAAEECHADHGQPQGMAAQ
jgi:hypothetical protein